MATFPLQKQTSSVCLFSIIFIQNKAQYAENFFHKKDQIFQENSIFSDKINYIISKFAKSIAAK